MKKKIVFWLWIGLLPVWMASAEEPLLSRLQKEHPRILASDARQEVLVNLLKKDRFLQKITEMLEEDAKKLLENRQTVRYEIVGPRLLQQSRQCLRRILTLGTVYRLSDNPEEKKRYQERALLELRAAAAFPDWNPSHFLDTAEMTAAFAIGYDWFYATLSEEERGLLETAIYEKGLMAAYRLVHPGRARWQKSAYNWNQVCNGGIVLGVLAIADRLEGERLEVAEELVRRALETVPRAMASFAPDGAWAEGPSYWDYTTQYTIYLIQTLEIALGNDFGLSDSPGFDRCGDAQMAIASTTGMSFNFADAGGGRTVCPQLLWLADRFQKPEYAEYVRRNFSRCLAEYFWYYSPLSMDLETIAKDYYFRNAEFATMRSSWTDPNGWFVGFKAGDNAVNHSHLELGTLVLDWQGIRWAVDLGGDNYNLPGYFGKQRWSYYRLGTRGQNTLVVNGENQDTKAVAPITRWESTPEKCLVSADLSAAYSAFLESACRTVTLDRQEGCVTVLDEIGPFLASEQSSRTVVWQIHTRAGITISEDGRRAVLSQHGKTLDVSLAEPAAGRFQVAPTTQREEENPNRGIQRLTVELRGDTRPQRIQVVFGECP